MLERKLLRNLDFRLIALALGLTLLGITVLESAAAGLPGGSQHYVRRQLLALAVAVAVMVVVIVIDYSDFRRLANLIYFLQLGLLVTVLAVGRTAGGATRWLQLGPIPLPQPSEVAKLAIIIALASRLADQGQSTREWWGMTKVFLYIVPSAALVLVQPDLGTALTFFLLAAGMLYVAGTPGPRLLGLGLAGLGAVAGALYLHLNHGLKLPLHSYQVQRLTAFLRPDVDPLHTGYQLIQSKIAIGSGRLWGKGLFAGTQNILRFIPEKHTDFIFSVVGEELGFAGSVAMLLGFLLLAWGGIGIARRARDQFGALLAVGVVVMWTSQMLINVGMTVGITPVTGLPLPFLSYGGSSLLTNYAALGLVLNVGMRRHKILF
jgi:rod shape determining protein RodA